MLTPEKPDKQKGAEKPQTEGYHKAKPVKERLAYFFASMGGIFGFVVTWAIAEHHRTTFFVALISGVLSFLLAAYLYWSPDKGQDESAEVSHGSLTLLGLNAPPVKLAPELKTQPESTLSVSQEHKRPVIANEPNAVASLSDFRVVYDADNILEIEVSYTYDGSFGNEGCYVYAAPLKSDGLPIGGYTQSLGDIRPTRRKAKTRTRYEQNWLPDEPLKTSQIQLTMQRGGDRPFYYEVFPYVKVWMPAKPAEPTNPPEKVSYGSADGGAGNRESVHRSDLAPDIEPKPPKRLGKIPKEILVAIAHFDERCTFDELEEYLNHQRRTKGKEPLKDVAIRHYLNELDKQGYIIANYHYLNRNYKLHPDGMEYLVKRKLV